MLSAIRKNQHSLTLIIVILTIISFIWLYNRTNLSQVGSNDIASVYGRVIQQAEIERQAREYQLAIALGLTDFVRDLGGFADNEEIAMTSFIFNSLVIEHQATVLDIIPTDEMVATSIQALSVFQVDGVFNAAKYASFLKDQLIPRGFTERHLEEVICNSLRLKKLREVITSPVSVSETQVRELARIYQPVTAQVIRFTRDAFLKDPKAMTITPEEEKAFYEKNKSAFVSDEARAVNYVVIELPPEQQKLQGKERVHAMQQLSDAVSSLKQKGEEASKQGKNFEEIATKNGFKVITSTDFNRRGEKFEGKSDAKTSLKKQEAVKKIVGNLPPKEVVLEAFKLSKINDLSEVIQVGQAFYIVSLVRITPSHPLSFSDVQLQIEVLLRKQKADKVMNESAVKTFQTIHQAMAANKNFSEALKGTGKTAEALSGLVPADMVKNKVSPEQQGIINATIMLKEGELSELKHAAWGDFIVYMDHRAPLSASNWAAHYTEIEGQFLKQQQNLLFFEWLRQSRVDAKITMLDKRHRAKTR